MHLIISSTVLLIVCTLESYGLGRLQSVATKGRLICNGKPAVGIKVKLYDEDRTDIDDLMDETVTDKNGTFHLKGSETEITTIDPKVNIYHKCNDEGLPCQQKLSIMIDDSYVSDGQKAEKIFDIGEINLGGKFSGQTRDCLN